MEPIPLVVIFVTAERCNAFPPVARLLLHSGCSEVGGMTPRTLGDAVTLVKRDVVGEMVACAGTKLLTPTLCWLKSGSYLFIGDLTPTTLSREWVCLSAIVYARVPPAHRPRFRLWKAWQCITASAVWLATFHLVFSQWILTSNFQTSGNALQNKAHVCHKCCLHCTSIEFGWQQKSHWLALCCCLGELALKKLIMLYSL